jgi:uncharacterized membrane protein
MKNTSGKRVKGHTRTSKTWLSIPIFGRLVLCAVIGAAAAAAAGVLASWNYAPLVFWDVTALLAITALWLSLRTFNAKETEEHAAEDDPGRGATDAIMILASIASLVGVGVLIVQASGATGVDKYLEVGLGVLSVVVSWISVHTIYMLRYADLYTNDGHAIEFNSVEAPTYSDFAYLSFTVGMTYQISDNAFKSNAMRRLALGHAMLSYLFGTAIIATTINFIGGLAK